QAVLLKPVSVCSSLLQETASRKKDLIRSEFSEIKVLIEETENQTLKVIADEEKRVCNKFDYIYGVLGSKKNEIQSLRDQIEMALTEGDDILFLKRAAALQRMSTKEAFIPAIEMDQNIILSAYQSAINLKEAVKLATAPWREKRAEGTVSLGELAFSALALSSNEASSSSNPNIVKKNINPAWSRRLKQITSRAPLQPEGVCDCVLTMQAFFPTGLILFSSVDTAPTPNPAAAVSSKELIDSFLKKSREELLQYAANITLDYNTAHNKVVLSEGYTRMSVSDIPMNYNNHPQRFTDCSQVLGFQCFKRGIHYWEVELQQNNFCGIGICYGSMNRHGPESRLGRNSSSWCIEWFNCKISSWHNDVEKCLPNVKATKIGVLLHCEGGFVIFMAVGEKHNLIYKFKTQFTEALYPAFWLFSSGTVLSLCQM
ncbi:E3 ubiquitin/ISG15 ligase TRIM25, partial [Pelecanus crispus]